VREMIRSSGNTENFFSCSPTTPDKKSSWFHSLGKVLLIQKGWILFLFVR
jgi:hypothetical protein